MLNTSQRYIITKAARIVRTKYIHDIVAHDWCHIERVWKMARKLSQGMNVNRFVVELAALLHDVDDYKFSHSDLKSYKTTREILKRLQVDVNTTSKVVEIVKNVSFKGAGVATYQVSIEGKIVQDADRLDGMGAIAVARTFAYNGAKGNPIYDPKVKPAMHQTFAAYKVGSTTAINHFYEKLLLIKDRLNTSQAKKLAVKRHEFMKIYLREFFRELQEAK